MNGPHALVHHGSEAQKGLLALGWTIDSYKGSGMDRMVPPTRPKLLDVDKMLVVRAPTMPDEDVEALRDAVDMMLRDPDFAFVTNHEVQIEVIPVSEVVANETQAWDVVATRPKRA